MAKNTPDTPENAPVRPDLRQPYVWVATFFGAGLMRPAPGKWGSLASVPPALGMFFLAGLPGVIAGIVIFCAAGFWAAARFDAATGGHDNKAIVIDEAAGQWIALLPGFYLAGFDLFALALAFALFRAFDILKPWPISWLDRHVGGVAGVMLDDIAAGIFAAVCMAGILHYVF